jgi:hypothetical protein
MKKIELQFLFGLLFFLGFNFFLQPAHATDILDLQQNTTTNYLYWTDTWRVFGQTFVADQNNISKLYLYYAYATSTISICQGIPAPTSQADVETKAIDCGWAGNTLIRSEILHDDLSVGEYIFSTPVPLTIGQNYYFVSKPSQEIPEIASYNANGAGGMFVDQSYPNTAIIAFKTYYSDTYTPPPPSTSFQIHLNTPFPTPPYSTYPSMPGIYNFSYENPINWYPQIRFMVKRQADAYAHAWPDFVNSATFWTQPIASSSLTTATTTFKLPDGTYDLDVYFWASLPSSPVHATTTFSINTGGSYGGYSFSTSSEHQLIVPPTIDYSKICEGIATSTDWSNLHIYGDIECGVKRALYATIDFAFTPSFDTLQNFRISYDLWKGCFPFNSYFDIIDTIKQAAASSTASTTSSIKIPFIRTNGSYYMMPVISSSTLSNWIGFDNYILYRTTIGYFLWLIAVAVVYFTIRKI